MGGCFFLLPEGFVPALFLYWGFGSFLRHFFLLLSYSDGSILLVRFFVWIFDIGIFSVSSFFFSWVWFYFLPLLFSCQRVGVFFTFVRWGISCQLLDCAG